MSAVGSTVAEASKRPPRAGTLRARALQGAAWTMAGYGASQVLRLGSNLVLTRLLFPEAFGLMTLVAVFMQGLQMFSDIGVAPSIIQHKRGHDPAFLNTAWTLQVLRGFAVCAVACVLAVPYARYYGHAPLGAMIIVASTNAVFNGFNSTRLATQNRELAIGRLALIDLTSQVSALVAMVSWVWVLPTVWGLVAGGIVGSIVRLVLSHTILSGTANRFCWDATARTELFRFGRWIFCSTALTFVAGQADRLVFGSLASLEVLGVYAIALTMAAMPTQVIQKIGSSVLFPIYSRIVNSGQQLSGRLDRARLPLLVSAGAVLTLLVAAGPHVIGLLYDARYADAGWMLRVLAVGAWFQCMAVTSGAALMALGQSKSIAGANLAKFVTFVVAVPIAFSLGGFTGAVCATIVGEIAKYWALVASAHRAGLGVFKADVRMTTCFTAGALISWWAVATMESNAAHPAVVVLVCGLISGLLWLGPAAGLMGGRFAARGSLSAWCRKSRSGAPPSDGL